MRNILIFGFILLALPVALFAQDAAQPAGIDWGQIGAAAINSALVLLAVQAIKVGLPFVNQYASWLLPFVSPFLGVGLGWLETKALAVLGWPVDLSAIMAAFSGAGAVAIHQTYRQAVK